MKKWLILGMAIALPIICTAQAEGDTSHHVIFPGTGHIAVRTGGYLFRAKRVGSTCQVWTTSDEVYLRIMREYRIYVKVVYMWPNKWGKTGEYTDYTIVFPREFKPRIEHFLKTQIVPYANRQKD